MPQCIRIDYLWYIPVGIPRDFMINIFEFNSIQFALVEDPDDVDDIIDLESGLQVIDCYD